MNIERVADILEDMHLERIAKSRHRTCPWSKVAAVWLCSDESTEFRHWCGEAKIKPTKRQANKWRRFCGLARQVWRERAVKEI